MHGTEWRNDSMVVVFEFLSEEPIENLITCMNFKVDKLVLFGNYDRVASPKEKRMCSSEFSLRKIYNRF